VLETVLFPKLKAEAMKLRPRLIIIDPSADVGGGDKLKRDR
jgi:RecA-family ATPase